MFVRQIVRVCVKILQAKVFGQIGQLVIPRLYLCRLRTIVVAV